MSELKNIEQPLNVKFLVKLGKSGTEINEMLSIVYGEDTLKSATVYKWVKHFQEWHEDVGNEVKSGHSSSSCTEENVDRIYTLVLTNRRITSRQLAKEVHLIKGTVHMILCNDLQLMKGYVKLILRILRYRQKQNRVLWYCDWLDNLQLPTV